MRAVSVEPIDLADALEITGMLSGARTNEHDYYIAHGNADVAVPVAEHSERMLADVGSNVRLEIIEGGVHGTFDNSYYGAIVDRAFAEHPAIDSTTTG